MQQTGKTMRVLSTFVFSRFYFVRAKVATACGNLCSFHSLRFISATALMRQFQTLLRYIYCRRELQDDERPTLNRTESKTLVQTRVVKE